MSVCWPLFATLEFTLKQVFDWLLNIFKILDLVISLSQCSVRWWAKLSAKAAVEALAKSDAIAAVSRPEGRGAVAAAWRRPAWRGGALQLPRLLFAGLRFNGETRSVLLCVACAAHCARRRASKLQRQACFLSSASQPPSPRCLSSPKAPFFFSFARVA